MSAETENTDNNEIESEARELGWVPKDEFRGDESRWVTAEKFVEHGKHVMPILRKNNERLLENQKNFQQQINTLSAQLKASQGEFETLQEFHQEEVVRRVEETRKQLLDRIKEAKRDNDIDTEVDLTDQLTQLNAAKKEADESNDNQKDNTGPQQPALAPEYVEWKSANPWFENDFERTHETLAIAAKITREKPELRNKDFYRELDKRLNGSRPRGISKVEGSSGGSSNGSGGGHSYADLPAEAKAACDKFAKKFVNSDGRFKTESDYRKHYVKQLEQTGFFSQ